MQGILPASSQSGLQAQMPNLDVCLCLPLLGPFSLSSLGALGARTVKTSGKPVSGLEVQMLGGDHIAQTDLGAEGELCWAVFCPSKLSALPARLRPEPRV